MMKLKGKIAVVTGAGGLLGPQHVDALLEEGAKVFATDVYLKSLKDRNWNKFLDKPIIEHMDVTKLSSINNFNTLCGPIDILINNACLNPSMKSSISNNGFLEKQSLVDWNHQIEVGLTGAFLCSQIFGISMAKRKSGVIINIASDLSVIAPDQRLYQNSKKPITYSVIKHGLIGLTKYLAEYWAKDGVRVNALSPGGIFDNHESNFVNDLTFRIPMGRMAKVDEYKGAIKFLASSDSNYMTGQNLIIDGGRTII